MRRFKEWDLDFHRVITNRSDDLNHQIESYWEDRSTRPKTDGELLARLHADGFTVTLSAGMSGSAGAGPTLSSARGAGGGRSTTLSSPRRSLSLPLMLQNPRTLGRDPGR